jgi:hypothetical protein
MEQWILLAGVVVGDVNGREHAMYLLNGLE